MKSLIFCVLLVCSTICFGENPSLQAVRSLYQQAAAKETSCQKLIDILAPFDEKNHPLFLGYRASGTMMMAKHVFNPFTKLSWFKKGRKMLESAIGADQENVELRFLRFAVQTNIPSFLGYHDSISGDKNFLLQSLRTLQDASLRQMIVACLNDSDYVTVREKQNIK